MRKIIYAIMIIIALVIIFLLASPVYYGKCTKHFMRQAIVHANRQYAPYRIKVRLVSFKRRWYSSDAVVEVSVNNLAFKKFYKKYIDPNFNLKQAFTYKEIMRVEHGPVIYHSTNGLSFSAASLQGYAQIPAALKRKLHLSQPLLSFAGTVSYRGAFRGNIIMAPIHYHSKLGTFDWQGVAFHGRVGAALKSIKGSYVNQAINAHINASKSDALAQDVIVQLSPSTTQLNMQRHAGNLWTGSMNTFIKEEKVLIHDRSSKRNAITESRYQGVSSHVVLSLQKKQYNIDYHVAVKSLLFGGKYHANNIDAHVIFHALDANTLIALQKMAIKELSVQGKSASHSVLDALNKEAVKLITPQTKVEFKNFSIDFPQGNFKQQAAFSWPQASAQQTFSTLMFGIKVDAHVSVAKSLVDYIVKQIDAAAKQYQPKPKPLPLEPGPVMLGKKAAAPAKPSPSAAYKAYADQAQSMLAALVSQGYIILQQGYYSSKINYSLGQLIANGKKIQL